MSASKNITASIKARLLIHSNKISEDFNLVLVRYGIERLLYRLSKSQYADKFLLKGAMLFALWDAVPHRPTRDLDLMGFVPGEVDSLIDVFREIIQISVEPDGLIFDESTITAQEIRDDDSYGGIRLKMLAWLGSAKIPIQVDIGVGDVVTPAPEPVVLPVILELPAPNLRAYPIYTVVAEKIEAATKLKETNSRMKDFFDLWFLFHRFDFDQQLFVEAIKATFKRRGTALPIFPEPFTESLANDLAKQKQWDAFLRRNRLEDAPEAFDEVILWLQNKFKQLMP